MPVGCLGDIWGGLADLSDDLREQIQTMLSTADFQKLQSVALLARLDRDKTAATPGLTCTIDPSRFASGFNNVVLKISFSDGERWVARIQHVPMDTAQAAGNAADLLSEIATMNTVRDRTQIPVPRIFAFDTSPNSEVGYPYILMEHIEGKHLGGTIASRVPPAHLPKVASQLAEVLFQLYELSFDHLGRLWRGTTGSGPVEIVPVESDDEDSPRQPPRTSLEWLYT